MKRMLLTVSCICATLLLHAQAPGFQWARAVGGRGFSIVADAAGNVYTGGYFSGTADFDPGPATFFMTADGAGADDAYISKLDAAGNFVWAARIGGDAVNYINEITLDAAGNVYATGYFTGIVDLDPGPATFNITSLGAADIFVVKLDAGGNFVWAKVMAGTNAEFGNAIAIDLSGNVLVTGSFGGTVDFDPGPSVANMVSSSSNNCFIVKLDSDGNYIWANKLNGIFSQSHSITTDAVGNIYTSGTYSGTVDFDPSGGVFNLTGLGSSDVFVLKFNSTGGFIFARGIAGTFPETDECIRVDASGNIYTTGRFANTTDFDPGPGVFNLTSLGSDDAFISKLDASGNFVWAIQFGGSGAEVGNGLALDAAGNVYTTGIFQNTADFDPGPGVANLTALSNDIFISKIDASGNYAWAISFLGAALDAGNAIALDAFGNVLTTGFFQGSVDFDHTAGSFPLIGSSVATFIHKMGPGNAPLPLTLLNFSGVADKGGNIVKWETAKEINTALFDIEWSNDGQVFTKIASREAAGNSIRNEGYSYLHKTAVDGNNYYRLKMIDKDGRFTYSNIIKVNNTITAPAVIVFTNPVVGLLQLQVRSVKNETFAFTMHSTDGRVVSTKSVALIKGINRLSWSLPALPAGNYFIASPNFETVSILKQ